MLVPLLHAVAAKAGAAADLTALSTASLGLARDRNATLEALRKVNIAGVALPQVTLVHTVVHLQRTNLHLSWCAIN